MIQNKKDYIFFKEADRIISGREKKNTKDRIMNIFMPDYIARFMYLLRTIEYYKNCRPDLISKIRLKYLRIKFHKISIKLGFSIPVNVFGPGLSIPHHGTIVVNENARIGANCVLHTCVCIAGTDKKIVGDNAYFSTGVVLTGKLELKDNITFSANSLINRSFDSSNQLIGGTPAKILKERNAWFIEDGKIYEKRSLDVILAKERIYNKL